MTKHLTLLASYGSSFSAGVVAAYIMAFGALALNVQTFAGVNEKKRRLKAKQHPSEQHSNLRQNTNHPFNHGPG